MLSPSPSSPLSHPPEGEWESSLKELQRMLVVRSLRQDRISFCVTSFIVNNLGSRFVEPPALDMKAVSAPGLWLLRPLSVYLSHYVHALYPSIFLHLSLSVSLSLSYLSLSPFSHLYLSVLCPALSCYPCLFISSLIFSSLPVSFFYTPSFFLPFILP